MGFLTVRERHIDEYLKTCLAHGVQQVVILGAGYDARAYRFDEFKRGVKVFEVDHPATQQAKLKKLAKIFGGVPQYVTYVPIDFNTQTLEQRLRECGYDDLCEDAVYLAGRHAIPHAGKCRQYAGVCRSSFRSGQFDHLRLYVHLAARRHGETWRSQQDAARSLAE